MKNIIINEYTKLIGKLWNGVNYNWSFKETNLWCDDLQMVEYNCKPFNPNKGIALSITNFKCDMSIIQFLEEGNKALASIPMHVFKQLQNTKYNVIIGFWENGGKVHLEYTLYFPNVKSPKTQQLIKFLKLYFNLVSVWDFAQQKELKEI